MVSRRRDPVNEHAHHHPPTIDDLGAHRERDCAVKTTRIRHVTATPGIPRDVPAEVPVTLPLSVPTVI